MYVITQYHYVSYYNIVYHSMTPNNIINCYCQRPLHQPDTAVIVSVQVRLKTRPWAGRPVFSPGGGRARARSAPAHKSLADAYRCVVQIQTWAKMVAGIVR